MNEEEVRQVLVLMEGDSSLITESAFRANSEVWPDNRISFTENHLAYLKGHPSTNPQHYLSNLRLMIKKRS